MGVCQSSSFKDVEKPSLNERLQYADWKNTKPFVPQFIEGKIIKCYDGDTVTIATVINDSVYRFNIRMLGYDCAEIKSKDPEEKKVAKWAKESITNMCHNKMVRVVKNQGYDKYGRLLLELEIGKININHFMKSKWGVSYDGGHKDNVDWTKWGEDGFIV